MPDETITEEHQITRILKRWFRYHSAWTMGYTILMIAVYLFMFKIGHQFEQDRDLILMTLHLVGLCGISYMLKVNFARQLSLNEQKLLAKAQSSDLGISEARLIGQFLKECDKSPAKVLLRASQQPQAETLLRAAQYTDDTPKEQLLRPTSNDEK